MDEVQRQLAQLHDKCLPALRQQLNEIQVAVEMVQQSSGYNGVSGSALLLARRYADAVVTLTTAIHLKLPVQRGG